MSVPIRQRDLLLNSKITPAYSVSFRSSGYDPVGVREDLARGMVARVAVGDERVRNDFDRVPIFQRPVCNATWDKRKKRWVDFAWQGEQGFSWSPTEPFREVLYRCQPFWYCVDMSDDAPCWVSVSQYPLEGYSLAPMFKNGKDFVYRPCFEMGIGEDGLPHSRAGLKPCKLEPPDLMGRARSFDTDAATTERAAEWFSDLLLLWVEFGTRKIQTQMHGFARVAEVVQAQYVGQPEPGVALLRLSGELADRLFSGMFVSLSGEQSAAVFCKEARVKQAVIKEGNELEALLEGKFDFSKLYESDDAEREQVSMTLLFAQSGLALPCVCNASSGAPASPVNGYTPMTWRGKENAWGNLSSLICDVRLGTKVANGVYRHSVYSLDDCRQWSKELNENWRLCDIVSTVQSWAYIQSFACDSKRPWVMFPKLVQGYSSRYHCAVLRTPVYSDCSLFTGGGHYDYKSYVSPCSQILMVTNSWDGLSLGGARLILHEGGL